MNVPATLRKIALHHVCFPRIFFKINSFSNTCSVRSDAVLGIFHIFLVDLALILLCSNYFFQLHENEQSRLFQTIFGIFSSLEKTGDMRRN